MSGGFIPREKLTAYQRWELAAFDEEEKPPEVLPEEPPAPEPPPEPEHVADAEILEIAEEIPDIVMPTAAEIERIHEDAREQGYTEGWTEGAADGQAKGYEEGHAEGFTDGKTEGFTEGRTEGFTEGQTEGFNEGRTKGYEEGHAEGLVTAQQSSAHIVKILDDLGQAVSEVEQKLADQLLAVALEIASQVIRQSLKVKPELILPSVREAMAALQLDSGSPVLLAHPDDAALIRAQMDDQMARNDWRIIEDRSLTRGGCRLELGASEVDATLETRWKRALKTIGATSDWVSDTP